MMLNDEYRFNLIRPFHIDSGELDGLRPQECFVLGYELAQVDSLVERPGSISRPVHAANRDRIVEACQKARREFRLIWLPGDTSESWMQLDVMAAN